MAGDGTSGFEFLKTDFNARSSAMGKTFIAMRGDINGIFHNPAGLAYLDEQQFAFNYVSYLLDIGGGFAGYSRRIENFGQISMALIYMDYGQFDETNLFAEKTGGSFSASDLALAVSYADHLEEYFKYGVTAKFIHSSIDIHSADAFAFDFGLIYEAPFEDDLYIGISLVNFGQSLSAFIDTKESLPLSLRFGLAKKLAHLPLEFNFSINDLNIQENTAFDRLKKFSIGGEFTLSKLLRLRLGYDNELHRNLDTATGAGFSGVSLGFGIYWKLYRFDYAFSSFGDLGAVHRFGINGTF